MSYDPSTPTAHQRRSQDAAPGTQETLREPQRRRRYHEHAIASGEMAIQRFKAIVAPTKAALTLLEALHERLDAFHKGVLIVTDGCYPEQDRGTDPARRRKPDQEEADGRRYRGYGETQP